ncbi:hypothetical protein IFR05_011985 [Cadophora sp. M221]|nr:hypothetical protein IFR05_011985 [Cadophora sp. M221]
MAVREPEGEAEKPQTRPSERLVARYLGETAKLEAANPEAALAHKQPGHKEARARGIGIGIGEAKLWSCSPKASGSSIEGTTARAGTVQPRRQWQIQSHDVLF